MVSSKNSVLIVDADRQSRNTLETHFKKLNWIVYTASDGRSAIQSMHRNNPDIIIMDIVLPVRDGITTCHLIRSDVSVARHFPIIMMIIDHLGFIIRWVVRKFNCYVDFGWRQ